MLNKEHILRVYENRILRPRRNENEEWRRLHNEELHSLYRSPNILTVIKSRRLRWAGQVTRMEYILTGKHTGKSPLGTIRHRWEDYIRMDLKKK